MCKIRDAGKVKARDRIAVLAALNLAFDVSDRNVPSFQASASLPPSFRPWPRDDAHDPRLASLLQLPRPARWATTAGCSDSALVTVRLTVRPRQVNFSARCRRRYFLRHSARDAARAPTMIRLRCVPGFIFP